jgi:hypothetical protein
MFSFSFFLEKQAILNTLSIKSSQYKLVLWHIGTYFFQENVLIILATINRR